MGMIRTASAILAIVACLPAAAQPARAEESTASREARWHDVAKAIFQNRPVLDGSAILQLEAPDRALDASLVPIRVTANADARIVAMTVVVDDNPAPVAAIVHFGPLADPHLLKLRVRVDQYTLIHAVAELQDGRLVSVSRFVKAAGGCSAPGSTDSAAALATIGRMKLHLTPASVQAGETVSGAAEDASLLISHPNANGMQMNPVTRLYISPRYVQTVEIRQGGASVLTLQGDISMAQDPAIGFVFRPAADGQLDVTVEDSTKSVFHQSFPAHAGGAT